MQPIVLPNAWSGSISRVGSLSSTIPNYSQQSQKRDSRWMNWRCKLKELMIQKGFAEIIELIVQLFDEHIILVLCRNRLAWLPEPCCANSSYTLWDRRKRTVRARRDSPCCRPTVLAVNVGRMKPHGSTIAIRSESHLVLKRRGLSSL